MWDCIMMSMDQFLMMNSDDKLKRQYRVRRGQSGMLSQNIIRIIKKMLKNKLFGKDKIKQQNQYFTCSCRFLDTNKSNQINLQTKQIYSNIFAKKNKQIYSHIKNKISLSSITTDSYQNQSKSNKPTKDQPQQIYNHILSPNKNVHSSQKQTQIKYNPTNIYSPPYKYPIHHNQSQTYIKTPLNFSKSYIVSSRFTPKSNIYPSLNKQLKYTVHNKTVDFNLSHKSLISPRIQRTSEDQQKLFNSIEILNENNRTKKIIKNINSQNLINDNRNKNKIARYNSNQQISTPRSIILNQKIKRSGIMNDNWSNRQEKNSNNCRSGVQSLIELRQVQSEQQHSVMEYKRKLECIMRGNSYNLKDVKSIESIKDEDSVISQCSQVIQRYEFEKLWNDRIYKNRVQQLSGQVKKENNILFMTTLFNSKEQNRLKHSSIKTQHNYVYNR